MTARKPIVTRLWILLDWVYFAAGSMRGYAGLVLFVSMAA